jgi:hypothetical protein
VTAAASPFGPEPTISTSVMRRPPRRRRGGIRGGGDVCRGFGVGRASAGSGTVVRAGAPGLALAPSALR